MHLTPELVATVLERQGLLTAAQAQMVAKEASKVPPRHRNPRAFEQRALLGALFVIV